METVTQQTATRNRNTAFRWHFYASILVLPILAVLALTGFVILLKPTIERIAYHDLLYVANSSSSLSLEEQRSIVESRYELAFIDAVVPPRDASRSTQFDITDVDGRALSVYVNPSTGKILGHINNDARIDFVATRIHGTLFMGKWGDYLIEIAAGWTLIMVFTGLVLWMPRKWIPGSLRRAFVPRLRVGGRKPWRDTHGLVGALVAPLLVFLLVTGLPWAGFWGERVWTPFIESLNSGSNAPAEEPRSQETAQEQTETAGLTVTWASEMTPMPSTTGDGSTLTLDRIREIGSNLGMLPGYAIGTPADASGVYTLSNAWPSRAQDERLVYLDQYSGKVLAETGWDASWGSLAQATSWGIDAHMGRQVGVVNGIAMGATCLGVLVSCITAPIMYLKRRRRGSLGIPRRPVGVTLPPWTRVGVIVICAIYPLLGASMILVWVIDRVLIRRVPALEAIFSHTTSTP